MQYAFFHIPATDASASVEELNRFLRGHRVTSVAKHFVPSEGSHAWLFCVEYLERPLAAASGGGLEGKVDYKAKLPPEQFTLFSKLRALRKEIAEKEGVPAYTLFTNEQLAALANTQPKSLTDLERIEGIGPARVLKYGEAFLKLLMAESKTGFSSP